MNMTKPVKQLSIGKIIGLHLLPGLPILCVIILLSNPTWGIGLPVLLSAPLAVPIALVPVQLGIIYYTAIKEKASIKDLLPFRVRTPIFKLLCWVIPLLLVAILVFMVIANLERPLWTIYNGLPQWFRLDKSSPEVFSQRMKLLIAVISIPLNGLLAPIVEEIYFRGFLLPRMTVFGKFAPICNASLFSLYHFWAPWELLTRIIAVSPFAYAVWLKKDNRISLLIHCTINTLSAILMVIALLK